MAPERQHQGSLQTLGKVDRDTAESRVAPWAGKAWISSQDAQIEQGMPGPVRPRQMEPFGPGIDEVYLRACKVSPLHRGEN